MVEEASSYPGPGVSPTKVRATKAGAGSSKGIDVDTAQSMLIVDFEQAFTIHNEYRNSERDLFKLSLKILSFPGVIGGLLLSAGLVSSVVELDAVLQLPIIYVSLIVSGVLNTIVLRAAIVTDRVQTEAKHQVNRLRGLYLHALQPTFPSGWTPIWGSTNLYLETSRKAKAAVLSTFIMAALNAGYVAFGVERLFSDEFDGTWWTFSSVALGSLYFLGQLERTWELLRSLDGRRQRPKAVK